MPPEVKGIKFLHAWHDEAMKMSLGEVIIPATVKMSDTFKELANAMAKINATKPMLGTKDAESAVWD